MQTRPMVAGVISRLANYDGGMVPNVEQLEEDDGDDTGGKKKKKKKPKKVNITQDMSHLKGIF